MDRRRFSAFVAMISMLGVVALLTQINITPAPAQVAAPKISGKMTDVVLKSFDAMGLPGLHSIQYRRLVLSPGFRIEGEANMGENHAELCMGRKGSVTVILLDGSRHTFKAGSIFNIPLNMKVKRLTVDRKVGFQEVYWSLNTAARP